MDKAVGDLGSNNQGIFMRVVHLTRISLGKDNVVRLWRVAYWGVGVGCVYHGLRWFLHLLQVSVSQMSVILNLARFLEYHLDLSYFRCMIGTSP